MKRKNNLYEGIIGIENLEVADSNARKDKKHQYGIKVFDRNRDANFLALHNMLKDKSYKTSKYKVSKIYEPKERDIYSLPYFPDRIVHHACMVKLDPIFLPMFTADTYSCIKGRGIHGASNAVKRVLRDEFNTQYCLKLDIRKFYPNIDHHILKTIIRRKIKDIDLLWLLDEIIDSAIGIPIGNYLSQTFANIYMTPFDHFIKEKMAVKDYFRYADDIVIFSSNKQYLHKILADIREYFKNELKLEIKHNYQIFPVSKRGVDFVGYKHYHRYTRLRKGIKKRFAKMLVYRKNTQSIASYNGWLKHCDSRHLRKKLLYGNKGNKRVQEFQN